jgi:Tfp pilus assembly protein PilV
MVAKWNRNFWRNQHGDTLIEVTFGLAILCVVLLSATSVASMAFRTGVTSKERTELVNEGQQQIEALRSFRDNHTWAEFRNGNGVNYLGVDTASVTASCAFDPTHKCFHMVLHNTTAGTKEWTPVAGTLAGTVATSQLEIWADTTPPKPSSRACDYDFVLSYKFKTIGGFGSGEALNHISTRLANLKYLPVAGGCIP